MIVSSVRLSKGRVIKFSSIIVLLLIYKHIECGFFESVEETGFAHQLVLMAVAVVLSKQDSTHQRGVLR